MSDLTKIAETCSYLLNNFPEAQPTLDYISSRISKESINLFEFGYFPNISNIESITNILGEEQLFENKLLFSKNIEDSLCQRTINFCYFEHHPLIIPFKNTYGKVVALVGRSLLQDKERRDLKIEKYKNTKESKDFKKGNLLFGLFENKQYILNQNAAYIVEGQFDVIKAAERGFRNVVALGNAHMTSYQFSLISRYTNNLFLLLDNDDAGEKGRSNIIDKFGNFANIHNFYIPSPYKDIDEYLSNSNDTELSLKCSSYV